MIFFYFLKIIFNISTSKRSKKYKSRSILIKKNLKFNKTQIKMQSQTRSATAAGLIPVGIDILFFLGNFLPI